jgi:cysteine-S-conjugate beta-lyase
MLHRPRKNYNSINTMAKSQPDIKKLKPQTRLVTAGRTYAEKGFVNPPVYHGSTILSHTVEELTSNSEPYVYGRRGTPTSRSAEEAIAQLEGGHACKITPSGLAAISTTLLAFLKAGDHLLMADAIYHPARRFCDTLLAGLGVETTYYDPLIGAGIADLIRPNTRVVYCESPGSQTMEVQDIPAITKAAHAKNCIVVLDNTWSGGHFFKAFAHGCDVSLQAATKYITGHSDVMLGCVTCNEATWPQFMTAYETMGQFAGPDDMYMALRGLHTLDVRLQRHMANAIRIAEWLRQRPEVQTVLYPALSNAPGHEIWKRDFTGASGLFSVILSPVRDQAVAAMLDSLLLFGMGYSWGGFESLCIPFKVHRAAAHWPSGVTRSVADMADFGPLLRFHIGLEDPDDLISDLDAGFERLRAAT